jgi:NADP-dependent 3-hydroxy acid dehydrogenase YdfG
VAWVTGASSGIGAATAVALAARGYDVAVGARRTDRLEAVAKRAEAEGARAFDLVIDVADPASIDAFCAAAERALGAADVLVNNAGACVLNRLVDARPEDLRRDVDVNLTGALLMAQRVVPAMAARRAGDVVWVTSENAVRPRPYQIAYSAAKAGLEAAARVLAMELEGTGVRSMILRVGPTGTEFGTQMEHAVLHEALAAWKYWGVQRHLSWMPAESVARAVVRLVGVPVEESYPAVTEVMPGGRSKEHRGEGG